MTDDSVTARSTTDDERNRLMGAGLVDDPYPRYHELRTRCPVAIGGTGELFGLHGTTDTIYWGGRQTYSALSHEESTRVLRDHATFSSRWYEPSLGSTVGHDTLIGLDPPEHQRLRSLLQGAFSHREVERWEHEFVAPIIASYLDQLVERGRADLYSEFAAHVPIHVTAVSLGLPPGDQDLFVEWSLRMTSPVVSADERLAASRAVAEYIAPLVEARRASAHTDLLGILVQAQVPDDEDTTVGRQPLSDDELAVFTRLLIIAGASTVFRAYGILLFALLTHPAQMDAVRRDRSLVPQAIEESLRWDQPLSAVGRLATSETSLGGVTIPEGCPVLATIGAANHDPAVWPDPERFDIFRDPKPHLTFGFGRHRCLGVNLARMELRIMLEATLDRFPNLRFDPDAETPHLTGLTFRMPTALPVVWDRTPEH